MKKFCGIACVFVTLSTFAMDDQQTHGAMVPTQSKNHGSSPRIPLSPACLELVDRLQLNKMLMQSDGGRATFYYWNHRPALNVDYSDYDDRAPLVPINANLALLSVLFAKVKARNPVELNVSFNRLSKIPAAAWSFHNLTTFIFKQNELDNPQQLAILFDRCRQLKIVDLAENKLPCLPRQIKYLKQLKNLNLFANQLTPQAVANLCDWCRQLQILDLSFNCIKKLPKGLSELTQLITLRLACNNIGGIFLTPLFNLRLLRTLDLSGNCLSGLPAELTLLPALQLVYLDHNLFSPEEKAKILAAFQRGVPQANIRFKEQD